MFVRILTLALVVLVAWAVLARTSEGAGPERSYVVQPGDTLWTIAADNYAGDPRAGIWEIRQRNGLPGSLIQPGQRLVLPRG
ncbi:MAG: LysM peptidoglycan-binding domain-containing protein [Thermoleophilia bacterium]|nr:LysM peptidoglycan-binding domain-containing protein [Thermoleophilia bacterium]